MMEPDKLAQLKIHDKPARQPGGRRFLMRTAMVLVAVALGLAALQAHQHGLFSPAVKVSATAVSWIYPSQVITELNASGYVVAQRRAAVASKGTGRLEYLGVREGSRVQKNQLIARLENDDLDAELDQVRAQLEKARADLAQVQAEQRTAERNWRRIKDLWQNRAVSLADYDLAEDRRRKAVAAVASAEANIHALEAARQRAEILIEYTVIRAPFDGVILTKDAEEGEVVAPFGSSINAKAAVVTMADFGSLMVEADVAEAFLAKVREGQACEIQLDALPDERFEGRVDTIVPTADRTRGTVLVKVRFERLDPRILPEMSVRVAFMSRPLEEPEKRPFLALHRDVLTTRDGARGIFMIKAQRAVWTGMEKTELLGDYIELGDPFQPGDQAVLNPPPDLRDGARVKLEE